MGSQLRICQVGLWKSLWKDFQAYSFGITYLCSGRLLSSTGFAFCSKPPLHFPHTAHILLCQTLWTTPCFASSAASHKISLLFKKAYNGPALRAQRNHVLKSTNVRLTPFAESISSCKKTHSRLWGPGEAFL